MWCIVSVLMIRAAVNECQEYAFTAVFSFKIKNEAKNISKVENFYKKVLTNKTFYGIVITY